MADQRYIDGSVKQSSHTWDDEDFDNNRLFFPVLGVVLEVLAPDDPRNKTSFIDDRQRGFSWEAHVLVLNDGKEGRMMLKNVLIAPPGPSGIDDFTQSIPRGSTQLDDGSRWDSSFSSVDVSRLDGDRCLVQFIGGKVTQPVLTSWIAHPSNVVDPSTSGRAIGSLVQGTPYIVRRKGATLTVDDLGSITIDTSMSGSKVSGTPSGLRRTSDPLGGDMQLDLKEFSKFEVNFNPTVPAFEDNPSLPAQDNPPLVLASATERSEENTNLYMDKDFIIAVAGQVAKIISNAGDITLQPAVNLYFGDELSEENMVLGQAWKTFMTDLMNAFNNHTHSTGTGPSGVPLPPERNTVTGLIDSIDDVLSDYIFGSKEAPDPDVANDKDNVNLDDLP